MSMPAEHMTSIPTLAELLQGYADAPSVQVTGIASDSRRIGKGYLFLAVQGLQSHGLDFIEQARAAGAAAIAWDSSTGSEPAATGLPVIAVSHLADKIGEIANRFFGWPSRRLGVIGTTGTNGKTTVAWMIAQAREYLGERCAYLGTLGHGLGEVGDAGGLTTPATVDLHRCLADFVAGGAQSASIEVSSHALSQGRVDGVEFDTAVFTNLTRDHLDYHPNMDDYFASKAMLFIDYAPRHCIVNVDTDYGRQLAALCGPEVVTIATGREGTVTGRPSLYARSITATERGSDVEIDGDWGKGRFSLNLPGDFNVANAIAVLAVLLVKGEALDQACDVMARLQAPPGRMQRVPGEGPAVYVDYAHTPNALDNALHALRAHCRGKLWCVFGCGGDRDRGKRPEMGRVAERLADRLVLTNDNPRSEEPARIVDDILAGLARAERATVVEDRAAAIAWAISRAAPEDTVLIAGKGHESYQEAHGERIAISDYAIAGGALAAREGAR
ncbi:MAG: UDP-N-acetylmuramoyl-L-alanyl-D-glutamate--2,6-diaminopimelate ligase [Woeseiaceae bacterium]